MGVGKMKFTYFMRRCIARSITLFVSILICTVTPKVNAQNFSENFIDTTDHAFDISNWLSQVYGFSPVVSLITEPATGYGAAFGLIHLNKTRKLDYEGKAVPPDISFAGGGKGFENLKSLDLGDWAYSLGGGIRYLLAKKINIYSGIDVARGPEEWAFYIQFGHYWNNL